MRPARWSRWTGDFSRDELPAEAASPASEFVEPASGGTNSPFRKERRKRQVIAAKGAQLVLTGKASSIQRVSRALKAAGVASSRMRTKAYWAPGKTGLD